MKQRQELEAKVADMEARVKELTAAIEAERLKNTELTNQIKIIKLARNISGGEMFEDLRVTELKRKLNEYIREINESIKLLND